MRGKKGSRRRADPFFFKCPHPRGEKSAHRHLNALFSVLYKKGGRQTRAKTKTPKNFKASDGLIHPNWNQVTRREKGKREETVGGKGRRSDPLYKKTEPGKIDTEGKPAVGSGKAGKKCVEKVL